MNKFDALYESKKEEIINENINLTPAKFGSKKTLKLDISENVFNSLKGVKETNSNKNYTFYKYPTTYSAGGNKWSINIVKWDFKDTYDVFAQSGDYTVGRAPSYFRKSLIKGPTIAREIFQQFIDEIM